MNRMKLVASLCVIAVFCGCAAKKAQRIGFLSDYSKLEAQSKVSARYLAMDRLKGYSKLIIDPVKIHLHEGSKSKKKVTEKGIYHLWLKVKTTTRSSPLLIFSPGKLLSF